MVKKPTSRSLQKRTFWTLGALLLVNAAVARVVVAQIAFTPPVQQVLGTETVADQGQVVSDAPEVTTPEADTSKEITIYVVRPGDTISGIAQDFHITTGTIYAANDLTKNQVLKVGQKLVILPITGIQYTVKSGDTISGIAVKFDVPAADILDFNGIDTAGKIKIGDHLIIPNADAQPQKPVVKSTTTTTSGQKKSTSTTTNNTSTTTNGSTSGTSAAAAASSLGLALPVPGSVLTQGLHDVNAVDFGASIGTPVHAAKGGTVIVAKGNGGYNGGFGNFIVIDHGGMQTLYAHLSKVEVTVGEVVDQGDVIGKVGSTGKSTGPHLHFEVHGAKNPWAHDKKGTHY